MSGVIERLYHLASNTLNIDIVRALDLLIPSSIAWEHVRRIVDPFVGSCKM